MRNFKVTWERKEKNALGKYSKFTRHPSWRLSGIRCSWNLPWFLVSYLSNYLPGMRSESRNWWHRYSHAFLFFVFRVGFSRKTKHSLYWVHFILWVPHSPRSMGIEGVSHRKKTQSSSFPHSLHVLFQSTEANWHRDWRLYLKNTWGRVLDKINI